MICTVSGTDMAHRASGVSKVLIITQKSLGNVQFTQFCVHDHWSLRECLYKTCRLGQFIFTEWSSISENSVVYIQRDKFWKSLQMWLDKFMRNSLGETRPPWACGSLKGQREFLNRSQRPEWQAQNWASSQTKEREGVDAAPTEQTGAVYRVFTLPK